MKVRYNMLIRCVVAVNIFIYCTCLGNIYIQSSDSYTTFATTATSCTSLGGPLSTTNVKYVVGGSGCDLGGLVRYRFQI